MEDSKKITIEELVKALKKKSWNVNATKHDVSPLLVVYPNELLLELFGKDLMEKYWIENGA